jgi:exonuclease III
MNITNNNIDINKGRGLNIRDSLYNNDINTYEKDKKNNYKYKNTYIKMATHNVRGFNEETKQREMFDEYKYLGIDIIGITETKMSEKKSKNILNNKKIYRSWWTGTMEDRKTGGAGIAVKMGLDKHVVNVIRKMGRLISIDLIFKGKAKTRIINIYMHSNEKDKLERNNLINELQKLITEAKHKKYNIIVMGDMNADVEKLDNTLGVKIKDKYKIIQELRNFGFYDTQKITTHGKMDYTWYKNKETQRRLDQIWISESLIQSLIITRPEQNDLLRSDHVILSTILETNKIFGNRAIAREKKKKITRTVHQIDKMTTKDWEKFKELMDEKTESSNVNKEFNSQYKDQRWMNRV